MSQRAEFARVLPARRKRLRRESASLIAATPGDRQACAETMASKSPRLTATDSRLPPKHTSGPWRSPRQPPSPPILRSHPSRLFSLCRGKLRRLGDKEEDVTNWHLSSRFFVLVRTRRTFVKKGKKKFEKILWGMGVVVLSADVFPTCR